MIENNFVDQLLNVAKELKKLEEIRKSNQEFQSDVETLAGKPFDTKSSSKQQESVVNEQQDLHMEVFDDKDYDVDEVRNANFAVARAKSLKSNIIRTFVYKVPASTYVVRKCQIIIKEDPKPQVVDNNSTQLTESQPSSTVSNAPPITPTFPIDNLETKPKQDEQKPVIPEIKKKQQPKTNEKKFTTEDLILIDDHDDIADFNDDIIDD